MQKKGKPQPPGKIGTKQQEVRVPFWKQHFFTAHDDLPWNRLPLRNLFYGVTLSGLLIMVALSLQSGVNADDWWQNYYSDHIVNFYKTLGKDTTCMVHQQGPLKYYGGFFELATGVVNQTLGYTNEDLNYHRIRHVMNAGMGWMAMLFAALIAYELSGWPLAILTFVIAFLSPRFFGDSLMNPKDIPFAAGYTMALYGFLRFCRELPKPSKSTLLFSILGTGIAFGVRAGGFILFPYLFLFSGLTFLARHGFSGLTSNISEAWVYLRNVLLVCLGAYVFGVLVWPFAIQNPIHNPWEALTEFSNLSLNIRMLFEGVNVWASKVPWYYPLKWMWMSLPLSSLIGVVLGFIFLRKSMASYTTLGTGIVLFTLIFPVFFVIYNKSILYDGWRHLSFVNTSIALFAAMGWALALKAFFAQVVIRWVILAALALSLIEPAVHIARYPHYPFVYFNPVSGGIQNAFGEYETEYWGVSIKQAVEWMEEQGILKPGMDSLSIGTQFHYPLSRFIRSKPYKDQVRVEYVKYKTRYEKPWDYGIFPTRYVDGSDMRDGLYPDQMAIHTIDVEGVPICAIYKDPEQRMFRASQLANAGKLPEAIQLIQEEVKQYPKSILAWNRLAEYYFAAQQANEAKAALDQALKLSPSNADVQMNLGQYYLNTGDAGKAIEIFEQTVKSDPENAVALYYLAYLYMTRKDTQNALSSIQKCLEGNPGFAQAYELAARIYESMGDAESARRYREAGAKVGR